MRCCSLLVCYVICISMFLCSTLVNRTVFFLKCFANKIGLDWSWIGLILCFSGLNFLDLMVRQGTIDNPPKPPLVPGFECSGIVESVGENTTGFEVRERKVCSAAVRMNVSFVRHVLSLIMRSISFNRYSTDNILLSATSLFHKSVCLSSSSYTFLSDRRQSNSFCELQCLGRSRVHPGGFCLQDSR